MSVWAPKPLKSTSNLKKNTSKGSQTSAEELEPGRAASRPSTVSSQARDQPQKPERKFTLFPKLPPELRNKIWKLNIPGPRVVKITHDPKDMSIIRMMSSILIQA
jgi:hypothetical protein